MTFTAEQQTLPPKMSAPPSSAPPARFLILFDFDETIIGENSDHTAVRTLPDQRLPAWLTDSYREGQYNEHTQKILAYMADQGVSKETIHAAVEKIPPAPGVLELFQFLRSRRHDFELVVVSDANTYFIETWLQHAGVRDLFRKIFTNPGSFDDSGRLVLLPFHSHSCPRCPDNMCKQTILREYRACREKERGGMPFQRVFYVGDGANDVCPTQALGPLDTAFARRDFPMHKLLLEMQPSAKFKANMVPWVTGEDIVDCLRKVLEER
ncbi:probable phosphatase phospho1 isoform X1 [Oryzias melastigma]|nr:probable phosphatase phospho1 isoform X1 [Oryzias melastigma]